MVSRPSSWHRPYEAAARLGSAVVLLLAMCRSGMDTFFRLDILRVQREGCAPYASVSASAIARRKIFSGRV